MTTVVNCNLRGPMTVKSYHGPKKLPQGYPEGQTRGRTAVAITDELLQDLRDQQFVEWFDYHYGLTASFVVDTRQKLGIDWSLTVEVPIWREDPGVRLKDALRGDVDVVYSRAWPMVRTAGATCGKPSPVIARELLEALQRNDPPEAIAQRWDVSVSTAIAWRKDILRNARASKRDEHLNGIARKVRELHEITGEFGLVLRAIQHCKFARLNANGCSVDELLALYAEAKQRVTKGD